MARTLLTIIIYLFCITFAKALFHYVEVNLLPESALTIVVGFIFAVTLLVIYGASTIHNSGFFDVNTGIFIDIVLPPIIFDAGFHLERGFFINNAGLILVYAFVGTLLNTFAIGFSLFYFSQWIGLQGLSIFWSLTYGALISAVDPVAVLAIFEEIHVHETLNILVFGESVLNDAVSIVLFNLFRRIALDDSGVEESVLVELTSKIPSAVGTFLYEFIGGMATGLLWGVFGSWILRFSRPIAVMEPLLVYFIALCSYLAAQGTGMSGIISVLFCGMILARYADANMSKGSPQAVRYLVRPIASVMDSLIFSVLGIQTALLLWPEPNAVNTLAVIPLIQGAQFVVATVVGIFVYRFVFTTILTLVGNLFRTQTISWRDTFVLAYSGLRGGIAFTLAYALSESETLPASIQQLLLLTTVVVVLETIFVQGGTIHFFLTKLHILTKGDIEAKIKDEEVFDHPQTNPKLAQKTLKYGISRLARQFELIAGNSHRSRIRTFFTELDRKVYSCVLGPIRKSEMDYSKLIHDTRKARARDVLQFNRGVINREKLDKNNLQYALDLKTCGIKSTPQRLSAIERYLDYQNDIKSMLIQRYGHEGPGYWKRIPDQQESKSGWCSCWGCCTRNPPPTPHGLHTSRRSSFFPTRRKHQPRSLQVPVIVHHHHHHHHTGLRPRVLVPHHHGHHHGYLNGVSTHSPLSPRRRRSLDTTSTKSDLFEGTSPIRASIDSIPSISGTSVGSSGGLKPPSMSAAHLRRRTLTEINRPVVEPLWEEDNEPLLHAVHWLDEFGHHDLGAHSKLMPSHTWSLPHYSHPHEEDHFGVPSHALASVTAAKMNNGHSFSPEIQKGVGPRSTNQPSTSDPKSASASGVMIIGESPKGSPRASPLKLPKSNESIRSDSSSSSFSSSTSTTSNVNTVLQQPSQKTGSPGSLFIYLSTTLI